MLMQAVGAHLNIYFSMDKYSAETRSRMMAAVCSRGNRSTEKRLRAGLVRAGIRGWTVQPDGVIGNPDFIFPRCKLAVFVDGAFLHGAPRFYRIPQSRLSYWSGK